MIRGMLSVRNDQRYIRVGQLLCVSVVHNDSRDIKFCFKVNLPPSSCSSKDQGYYICHMLGQRQWRWNTCYTMLTLIILCLGVIIHVSVIGLRGFMLTIRRTALG